MGTVPAALPCWSWELLLPPPSAEIWIAGIWIAGIWIARLVLHRCRDPAFTASAARRNRLCRCLRALKSLTCALYYGLKKPGKSVPRQSLSTMHVPAAYRAN